jgi:origin recognition complex subunit 1
LILGPCTVSGAAADALVRGYRDEDDERRFVCLHAAHPARGLFYEFDWTAHRAAAVAAPTPDAWALVPDELVDIAKVERVTQRTAERARGVKRTGVRSPSKRARGDAPMDVDESNDDGSPADAYDPGRNGGSSDDEPMDAAEADVPQTPSRRGRGRPRGGGTPRKPPTTPSRRGRALAAPTPHSKAALRARRTALTVRPPPPQLAQAHSAALASCVCTAGSRVRAR